MNNNTTTTTIGTENGLSLTENTRFFPALVNVLQRGIKGDFADLGAWKGTFALLMAEFCVKNQITDRRIYLFDTFEGHPLSCKTDIDDSWGFTKKLHEFYYPDIQDIEDKFSKMGFTNYEIVKGNIEETLKNYENLDICFSTVDLNFYKSTKLALAFLEKTLVEGGLLFEDDYDHIEGVTLAYDESCFNPADMISSPDDPRRCFFYKI
tara:strand:- start:702 stop:1325 length:624 start_codon:yes stop_codon:yes gene_type:complete